LASTLKMGFEDNFALKINYEVIRSSVKKLAREVDEMLIDWNRVRN
jgi:hypothetical protein